jgi:hypothetical protein
MCNIPMSCGLIMLILQLGPFVALSKFGKVITCEFKNVISVSSPKCALCTSFARKCFSINELKAPSERVCGPQSIAKKFLLQMDDCVKDNKNWLFVNIFIIVDGKENV